MKVPQKSIEQLSEQSCEHCDQFALVITSIFDKSIILIFYDYLSCKYMYQCN